MKYKLAGILSLISLLSGSVYPDEYSFKIGEEIYKQTCISCHGPDGKANTNMELIVKPRDLSSTLLDEEQTYLITKEGAHFWGARAEIMPSFKSVYNEEQLRGVAHYISKKFNPNVKDRIAEICKECEDVPKEKKHKMLKRGKKIFKRNCSWCHGKLGKGDGVATKNPVDSIFPYDLTKTLLTKQQIFLYMKYGGKKWGTHGTDMPSWKRKYDDFTLRSVTRYIDEVLRKKK
ncbi:MAG: c-type cytochrome [Campylobacterota bacterium]|nr:c-type cytochrome [Campylobacterota bacterium]